MSAASATGSATPLPSVDTSNLATSLFSDLSPLLTLFGDEVTKQFLSTSMGWADCLLISTAPLGIVTIIISAIRISGYPLLKAIIGRVRDSPADEEKDILSSTSGEVREVWNGNRVIRQAGASMTMEFVYSTEREINPEYGDDWPIWTRKMVSAIGQDIISQFPGWRERHYGRSPYEVCDYKFRQGFRRRRGPSDPGVEPAVSAERENGGGISERAPNIIVNIPKAMPTRWSVWAWAFTGILVQSVVFAVNGLGVFYYQWPRSTYKVASYGFPVWAVGTISITIGVCICAKVIDSNTQEYTARPSTASEDGESVPQSKFHVVRLQKAIPEMKLPPFAMYNALNDPEVHVSERDTFPSGRANNSADFRILAAWTVVGSSCALSGFILQNIGTRELHWSAAVAQLVATLILTLIRAWVRRHVGDAPAITKELSLGFEAAELACDMYHIDHLMMYGGNIHWRSEGPTVEDPAMTLAYPPIPMDKASKTNAIEEPHILEELEEAALGISRHKIGLTAVQRVLQCQSLLVEFQPDQFKTKEAAEQMYDAAVEILQLLSITTVSWEQVVFFRGSTEFEPRLDSGNGKLEGLVKVHLDISHADSDENWASFRSSTRDRSRIHWLPPSSDTGMSRDRFCRAGQSLFNLTTHMYQFRHRSSFFQTLASCPIDEEHSREWQTKKEILGHGYSNDLRTCVRTSEGRIDRGNESMIIFGMSYSALRFDHRGVPYVEKGKAVEVGLFEPCNGYEDAFKAIRREFVMNFLHQLVNKNVETLKQQLDSSTSSISKPPDKWHPTQKHFRNTLFDSIADVLVKHKLEDDNVEAARLVAAAFLAFDVFPPIPEGFLPADTMELHEPNQPEPAPVPRPLLPRDLSLRENSSGIRRRAPGGGEEAQTRPEMEARPSER